MFNNLKIIRDKLGFTQNQVSDRAEITTRSYQNYESGKRIPKVDRAIAIAKVLNTTVEDLFETPSRQTKETNKSSARNLQNNNSIKRR